MSNEKDKPKNLTFRDMEEKLDHLENHGLGGSISIGADEKPVLKDVAQKSPYDYTDQYTPTPVTTADELIQRALLKGKKPKDIY